MSVYHNSFSYLGKNSKSDFGLMIVHFADNADSGETDTFLSTSAVYSESYDGTRQKFYGAKYDAVAEVQITVVKQDGTDFGISDNRKALRWLTGSRQSTWMDFYIGDAVKYRLLGRVKSVSQYKMDAKVVGLVINFESVSPYGYSAPYKIEETFSGRKEITIPCDSDELYSYVYMNTTYKNLSGNSLVIANEDIGDEPTEVTGLSINETISISDNMIITSSLAEKSFGNNFNFMFPKLVAGDNKLVLTGNGEITFEYITPVKLGNIAIDINAVSDPICDDEGHIQIDMLDWSRIKGQPSTLQGYGITNAYTKNEIDQKIDDVNTSVNNSIDRSISTLETKIQDKYYNKIQIDNIVSQLTYNPGTGTSSVVLWSQIINKPTSLSEYGIMSEVQGLISDAVNGVKVDINEEDLNNMLAEVLA